MFTASACGVRNANFLCEVWNYFQKLINYQRNNCPALPILAMLLTTIRKLVGSKLVMATDDERAVHFEEMRGIMKNSENKSFMQ